MYNNYYYHIKKYILKKVWKYININAFLLLVICLVGAGLRFYNISWDEGYYFHPDERNIASGILNLHPEEGDYNPNFFAYGTLPIYITRAFSGDDFNKAILTGRTLSAFFSVLVIILVYMILNELIYSDKKREDNLVKYTSLIGALITTFLPGMIQFAHFATFETFLTFEYLLVVWLAIRLSKYGGKYYMITGIVLGAAIATKIVSLAVLPVLLLAHFIYIWQVQGKGYKLWKKLLLTLINPYFITALVVTLAFAFLFSPYVILDYEAFQGSMGYEGPVARGVTTNGDPFIMFYTQQFLETIPVVYQFIKIFPYILGWPITIIGFISMVILLFQSIRDLMRITFSKLRKKVKLQNINLSVSIVVLVAYGYSLFHWSLYVKWTRYMIPLLPFLVIFAVVVLNGLYRKYSNHKIFIKYILICITVYTVIQGADYFSFYFKPDTRVSGATWITQNVDAAKKVHVLSEVYDHGILPFNGSFNTSNMVLFNFYDLDNKYDTDIRLNELKEEISKANYIIVPSNRIYSTKLRLSSKYPYAHEYYVQLFNGELGFELVKEFRRDTYLENLWYDDLTNMSIQQKYYPNFWQADESFRVFDRPTVLVFKRI